MTESQLRKLDGKRIRCKKLLFQHSIHYDSLQGCVEVVPDSVSLVRDGRTRTYDHIGFFLHPIRGKSVFILPHPSRGKSIFIPYVDIKLIFDVETLD